MTATTIAAEPPRSATTASAEMTAWAPPSATATARAVRKRARVRCVRWSRPPVRIESPRRRRETITSVVSSAGMPTNSSPIASDCHAGAALADADHRERRDREAERHAAAVAEEDPRGRGEQVVRQEPERGAAQRGAR